MRTDIKPNADLDGTIRFYVPEFFNEDTNKWELTHDYEQTHFKTKYGAKSHLDSWMFKDKKKRIRVEVYGLVKEEFEEIC